MSDGTLSRGRGRGRFWPIALGVAILGGIVQIGGGCGSEEGSAFGPGLQEDGAASSSGDFGSSGGEDGSADFVGDLTIEPENPVVDVSVVDGVITSNASVTFQARGAGKTVPASFTLDRGELGGLVAATGVFTASGNLSGKGRVTAQYRAKTAQTTVTVRLHVLRNGGPSVERNDAGALLDAGSGGYGGVGGNGPGGPVSEDTKTALQGPGLSPEAGKKFEWLYPYDKTVWPRGFLPPLLQWETSYPADAVYIHLKEEGYEFEGFYAGTTLVNHPLDESAWKQATNGNEGDDLKVEIKIASGGKVYGPIRESWIVAPGILRGAVYYNSYSSKEMTGAAQVLTIKPGARAPTVAIPGKEGKCTVCHTLSHDGSTLFAQEDNGKGFPALNWDEGSSFDLKNGAATIQTYKGKAPDDSTNSGKFVWSAVYPDGTFAMTSAWKDDSTITGPNPTGTTQAGYNGNSRLVRRDNGNVIPAEGWDDIVKSGVTPAFSPDGKHIAFNYWLAMSGDAGGRGHTLDVMDFSCTPNPLAPSGAPSCDDPSFSNHRRLYTHADTGVNGMVGWPAWLTDGSGVVFHNVVKRPQPVLFVPQAPLATWLGAQAELWYSDVPATSATAAQPVRMNALNGRLPDGTSYLPTNGKHPNDTVLNYEPTTAPVPAGGYYWVVFTSRRLYGNILTADPYSADPGTPKKLWVAAIDLHPTPGKDPSHPAFYLPGQELAGGNLRGFWANEPCRAKGNGCETGDECCTGYCRPASSGGALVCSDKPADCAQEQEKCSVDADCCGSTIGYTCINARCAQPPRGPK